MFFGKKEPIGNAALTARRTVADVMTAFTRTLNDLRKVEKEHTDEAERQRGIARVASEKMLEAADEADKAREVAGKLEALITPTAVAA